MSNYRLNNAANRDALFGPSKGGSDNKGTVPKHKLVTESNRNELFGNSLSSGKSESKTKNRKSSSSRSINNSSNNSSNSNSNNSNNNNNSSSNNKSFDPTPVSKAVVGGVGGGSSSRGYKASSSTSSSMPSSSSSSSPPSSSWNGTIGRALSGAAKAAKMKEADDLRKKADKAMERGLFTRPDPLTAANYYRRAAEAYGQCGENRLERLHRIASADCQMGQGSYPTAAAEYAKAAELARVSDEKVDRKRKEGHKLYSDASKAWTNAGEMGKSAKAQVYAALALTWGEDDDATFLSRDALVAMEKAVEAHVPDILNVYAKHRQTGISEYRDPDHPNDPSDEILALARDHAVKIPYGHEAVQELSYVLVRYGEYPSALYAAGAASYILENDGVSTLTRSRNYAAETVLQLAMGDPVAAEMSFLNRHVQHTPYLTTRECKLSEELFRAVMMRDPDALDLARSPSGSNRAALAQMHENIRALVHKLRLSGAARRGPAAPPAVATTTTTAIATIANPKKPIPLGLDSLTAADGDNNNDDDDDDDDDDQQRRRDSPVSSTKKDRGKGHDDSDEDDEIDVNNMQQEMDDIMASLDELGDLDDDDDDDLDGIEDDDIDLR